MIRLNQVRFPQLAHKLSVLLADYSNVQDSKILNALIPSPSSADEERRRSSRNSMGTVGVLTANDEQGSNPVQVMVIDVSIHGVGFRSPVTFAPGAIYRMRIGTGPLHLCSRLKITDSRPRPDGGFDVGAEFI